MDTDRFENPFRPGAGHMPPYLAGREKEAREFARLLNQTTILENLVLTGLRGIGKTVLLERFKPQAIAAGWLWVGTDLSEATSVSEANIATRLLTDLAVVTSSATMPIAQTPKYFGRSQALSLDIPLTYSTLVQLFNSTPGLVSDKLKHVLETAWGALSRLQRKGVIFAYDEAQNLTDHAKKDEFPLSLLLDVFQSIQRKGIPFMLALTGLPTLFPKLVEARTFAERMFHVVYLKALSYDDTAKAIQQPINKKKLPFSFTSESVKTIWEVTHGYPYFIQYVCRECFDVWVQNSAVHEAFAPIPSEEIMQKLDTDFFAGRWARVTDRQRELLYVIASLGGADDGEFTVQEVVELSGQMLRSPFSSSHVNQMLGTLSDKGLVFKNRHGKYSFAVPLMGQFIKRAMAGTIVK
jgi:AAA ATPase domain